MEHEFRCPICSEFFNEPVMLQCTHHICAAHVATLSSGERIVCPVCQEITTVPPDGLPTDRTLQLVKEQWQEEQVRARQHRHMTNGVGRPMVRPVCGFCEEQPATQRCVQCDGVMCDACQQTTHNKGFFKTHTIVGLDDAAAGSMASVSSKMVCDQHPEEKLTFYCVDCRKLVCSHCLIMGDHKGHQQTPVETAFETGKETLSAWVEKIMERNRLAEELLAQLRNADVEVTEGATAQREVINDEMDNLKEIIDSKRQQLLAKSALEEKQKRGQLQAITDRAQAAYTDSKRMAARCEELLALRSEHTFLAVVLPLLQDMKKLSVQALDASPPNCSTFRPFLTDAQVRCLGDLDLGHPKTAAPRPVNVQQVQPQAAGQPAIVQGMQTQVVGAVHNQHGHVLVQQHPAPFGYGALGMSVTHITPQQMPMVSGQQATPMQHSQQVQYMYHAAPAQQ